MRKFILISWLGLILSVIFFLFWQNEIKYSLPTPVPANYKPVKLQAVINFNGINKLKNGKPLLLHFFNPDCPCSRFNINHFKSLVNQYKDQLSFAVVVMGSEKDHTEAYTREKFGFDIPVLFDQSIAKTCGVYSTPQAVILDADNKLFYRGNYNKSRYCSDPKSNYAQMAIDSLLARNYHTIFTEAALKSYGCSLPNCKK